MCCARHVRGLATFYHIDYMAARIRAESPGARVLGMPDSGFWPDDPAQGFTSTFLQMHQMQNGTAGLPAKCVAKHASNLTNCLFPQYFAGTIDTPLFPLQSIYDPLQKGKDPESHGQWLLHQLNATVWTDKPHNGGWVHSCERHCGAELLTIDHVQVIQACMCLFK